MEVSTALLKERLDGMILKVPSSRMALGPAPSDSGGGTASVTTLQMDDKVLHRAATFNNSLRNDKNHKTFLCICYLSFFYLCVYFYNMYNTHNIYEHIPIYTHIHRQIHKILQGCVSKILNLMIIR